MYCVQDRQLICGLCLTVGGHQGHAVDDLQAAFDRERSTPALLLAALADSRWSQVLPSRFNSDSTVCAECCSLITTPRPHLSHPRQVCELGQQLEEEKSRCEDLVRRDRQEVTQYFETLEAALARKKRAFLDALDKAAADVSQAFEPLIDRVKELQVCVTQSRTVCQGLKPNPSRGLQRELENPPHLGCCSFAASPKKFSKNICFAIC